MELAEIRQAAAIRALPRLSDQFGHQLRGQGEKAFLVRRIHAEMRGDARRLDHQIHCAGGRDVPVSAHIEPHLPLALLIDRQCMMPNLLNFDRLKNSAEKHDCLRRLVPWAPDPIRFTNSVQRLPMGFKNNGVWGRWPQPPEALEFDKSSSARSGIIRHSAASQTERKAKIPRASAW